MPGPRGPRTRRSSIAAHVAQGVMAAHAAETERRGRRDSLMADLARSRAGTRAGSPVFEQDTPTSLDTDGLKFQVFEPAAEVFIEAEPGEAELACKHYMELMHMPRPSPPPSRQGIAQLFTGRSVRYEPIGKPPILLEPGKNSIQQLLNSLKDTSQQQADLKAAKKLAKKAAKVRGGSRTDRKPLSTAVVEPEKNIVPEELKETKLTTAQINRTAIRRRRAQHQARISLHCSNANAKHCSRSQQVISDICNDKSRLKWLTGAGVDFEKLCDAELSDSDEDILYDGTELTNRCRYIDVGSIPGLQDQLVKTSTFKAKSGKVIGMLKKSNQLGKRKSKEDWTAIDWDQYQGPESHSSVNTILGAFGAKPSKLALSSKLAKTPKQSSKDKLLGKDRQSGKTSKTKDKLALPPLAIPAASKGAAADFPLPMSARVTKKECSSALRSLLKRGKEDPRIFMSSELPAAMLHVKRQMNNFNKEIWGVRKHAIDVEHRAGADWASAVRRSFNNQRHKREVLNRAISKGINGCHISVVDIRSCAEVCAQARHLGCYSESSCYQAMQRRLKHMEKKEGIVPSFKTLKLFDTFEVLIEQESFLTVDEVLSVVRAHTPIDSEMQEIIDVLLAVLRVPVSFYTAWCQLHSISPGSRVKAQMKERHILYQRRKHKEALDQAHDATEKTPILTRQSSVVLQAKNDLGDRRVRRQSVISMEPDQVEQPVWVFGGQLTPHVQTPTINSNPQQPLSTTQSPHPIELAVGNAAVPGTQASRSKSLVEVGPQSAPTAARDSTALAAFMTECQLEGELAAPEDRMRKRLIQILARSDRSVEHTKLAERLRSTTTHRPTKVLSAREIDLVQGAESQIDIVERNGKTKVQKPDSIKKGASADGGTKTPRSRHNSLSIVSPNKVSGGCAVANLLGKIGSGV